jgi:hypothetical protein
MRTPKALDAPSHDCIALLALLCVPLCLCASNHSNVVARVWATENTENTEVTEGLHSVALDL